MAYNVTRHASRPYHADEAVSIAVLKMAGAQSTNVRGATNPNDLPPQQYHHFIFRLGADRTTQVRGGRYQFFYDPSGGPIAQRIWERFGAAAIANYMRSVPREQLQYIQRFIQDSFILQIDIDSNLNMFPGARVPLDRSFGLLGSEYFTASTYLEAFQFTPGTGSVLRALDTASFTAVDMIQKMIDTQRKLIEYGAQIQRDIDCMIDTSLLISENRTPARYWSEDQKIVLRELDCKYYLFPDGMSNWMLTPIGDMIDESNEYFPVQWRNSADEVAESVIGFGANWCDPAGKLAQFRYLDAAVKAAQTLSDA